MGGFGLIQSCHVIASAAPMFSVGLGASFTGGVPSSLAPKPMIAFWSRFAGPAALLANAVLSFGVPVSSAKCQTRSWSAS